MMMIMMSYLRTAPEVKTVKRLSCKLSVPEHQVYLDMVNIINMVTIINMVNIFNIVILSTSSLYQSTKYTWNQVYQYHTQVQVAQQC